MQLDEDVGKVAQATPILICKLLKHAHYEFSFFFFLIFIIILNS